jgi:DNA-directed RNA polymerase subunit E'/Rpb7
VLAFKLLETVTTGAFGPSPSKSLDFSVITFEPLVNVVVTVVITSSSFTGFTSSLSQEINDVIPKNATATNTVYVYKLV